MAITLVSYSSIGDWKLIQNQTKVKMTDLNEKMGIEVKIPDPLKRQVGQRRFGSHRFDNRRKSGRSYGGKNRSARDQYAKGKKSDNRDKKGHSYYGLRSRW